MPSDVKLLPCPFCGSANVDYEADGQAIFCLDCNAVGPESMVESENLAADLWNTRPDYAALGAADVLDVEGMRP